MRRPFARTFDLISSEYGWTDDQILDVTLGRLRQIRDVLFERRAEERDQQIDLVEAQTRQLAASIFSAAGSRKGADAASRITLFDRAKKAVKRWASTEQVQGRFGKAAFDWAEVERLAEEIRREKQSG